MKKHLFLFLLIMLCTPGLFSCGTTPEENPPEPTPSAVVLEFQSNGDGTCAVVGRGTAVGATVTIPETSPDGDTVISIAKGALSDSDGQPISELYIPATLTTMDAEALVDCNALKAITVAADNSVFVSIDGHLYTKDRTSLIKYASASTATSYTTPTELIYIFPGAFTDCSSLTSISLSSNLWYVLPNAFSGSTALTDIYYDGTMGSWSNNVYVAYGNDALLDAELHTLVLSNNTVGEVILCLDSSAAPITVENFLMLVGDGFYDGLTLHRIIEGFMIQGGDPNANGTGGSENKIKGEFSSNGVDNPLLHTRGVISMARSSDKDSASSQFFICHADASWLDGEYAAFGHVVEGMDVVDAIASVSYSFTDNNGSVPKAEQPVIVSASILTDYAAAEDGYDYVKLTFSYFSKENAK